MRANVLLLALPLLFADTAGEQRPRAPGCVAVDRSERLMSGQSFSTDLPRGLRLEIGGREPGEWGIAVVDPRTPEDDYMFVASPPYQVAPHHGFGAGWGYTAAQSASFARDLHFVLSARDYKVLFDLVAARPRTDETIDALQRALTRVKKGSLQLKITGHETRTFTRENGSSYEGFAWITFAGEACVPQ